MFMIITLLHCYLTVAVIAASRNAAARIGRRRSRDTMLFKCEAGLDVGRVRVSRPGNCLRAPDTTKPSGITGSSEE
jgi:hypothetical protein